MPLEMMEDANSVGLQRMVRKVQQTPNMHDPFHYKGVTPWELECHRLATDVEDNDTDPLGGFVRLKTSDRAIVGSWVDRAAKLYKVYTEWCPFGDLADLVDFYIDNQRRIPEPMIWHIAESLIRSGQRMLDVAINNNGNQIVHRDLKLGNVFLTDPEPNHYNSYPLPCVGDFGHAITTSTNDEYNPDWYFGKGTVGFNPVEMSSYLHPVTFLPLDHGKILEPTNVWQMGQTLRCLVLLEQIPVQSLFLDGAADQTYRLEGMGLPQAATYSLDLLRLIDSMMAFDTQVRPSFASLTATINNLNGVWDRSLGMRDGTATPAVQAANAWPPRNDIYQIGTLPPDPPPA